MSQSPLQRLDQEIAFLCLIGSIKATAALLGAAQTIDHHPADLGCLLDLIGEKAQEIAKMSGFNA